MKILLGLCGVARSGKDTFFNVTKEVLSERNVNCFKHSFAFSLKTELDDLCKKQLGFSAFTEDKHQKELIRDVLSAWGQLRRAQSNAYWIDKVKDNLQQGINLITDVRYQNEVTYIKNLGGKILYINRLDETGRLVIPANKDEEKYTLPLQGVADVIISWKTVNKNTNDLHHTVLETLNKLVDTNPPKSI